MKEKQENWFAVEIETAHEAEEAVEFALDELDSLGNEVNQLGKPRGETLTVIGYFNEQIDDEILRGNINESLEIYNFSPDAVKNITWREVENRDWLAEWKKHWRPTITEKFIVAPVWSEIAETEKTIIRIEPSMAFGTGTHETTRLCLKAVENHYESEMSFFDVGTGTGILAIAAAKIQGKNKNAKGKIAGCDTDEDSIKIAVENAELNDAQEIELYVGSIQEETPAFDFVCANLTADVIVPLLPLLTKKFNRFLILSGILKEQENLVTAELKKFGIETSRVETDGEWIGILIEKTD
jgi:ribosomal protein L11 methyltransferase